jgi:NADH-quinone oxidoreductase subunit M
MLNVILWLPLAVALVVAIAPRRLAGPLATVGSLASLGLAIALIAGFEVGVPGLQFTISEAWIESLGVRYELGVDGISLFLVLLTSLLWAAATLYSALQVPDRERSYFFMLGLGQTATLGAFLAQDLLLFVLFFDLMLIPFFFLIGGWGTGDRVAATIKMIVFTLVGSLLMLIAAIATAVLSVGGLGGLTFNLDALSQVPLEIGSQRWIFWFFAAAFLVKMPAFLLHGWMPDAYRAAPLPVLLLLSGVLSKVAAYGFLRIVLPLFPDATIQFQEIVMVIAVVSILYGSVMAFTQTNLRLIAGYSSVAQLGFITLGIFSLRPDGADGAVLHMFNHGLVIAPLMLIFALLWERYGSQDLREMGGAARRAPALAALFMVVTLALLALPGSANFAGEFFILVGAFESKVALALIASTGVVMAGFYALRMYQRTMHNELPAGVASREITRREGIVIAPLVACIVAIALYPGLILDRGEESVKRPVARVAVAACGPPLAAARPEGGADPDLSCYENYDLARELEAELERVHGGGGQGGKSGGQGQGAGQGQGRVGRADRTRCRKLATRGGRVDRRVLDRCLSRAGGS